MATAKKATKEATQAFESIAADTQKAAQEQFEKLTTGFEKISELGQENIDAVLKTQEIATKAAEGFSAEVSAFTKKSFDDSVAAAQDFATAKNVTELFEKQAAFAKSYFEGMVKQSTKVNDMVAATAKDLSAPVNARINATTETMKSFTV
jgi:phasin family protein